MTDGWQSRYNFPVLLAVLLGLFFLGFELSTQRNIPLSDDYIHLVQKYLHYLDTNSAGERFRVLFSPHNIHYPILNNAIVGLYYWTGTPLDFYWLSMLGVLARLASFGLIVYVASAEASPGRPAALAVLAAALFFFQPTAWQANHWAMMTMTSNLAWFFGFLAIAIASSVDKHPGRVVWAMLATMLAAMANTNGLSAVIVVVVLVWLRTPSRKSRVISALLGIALLATAAKLLSISMVTTAQANLSDLYSNASILERATGLLKFILSLLGQYWTENYTMALYIGSAGLLLYCGLVLIFLRRQWLGLVAVLLYGLSASIQVALGRYSVDPGLSSAFRYLVYSEVFWLVLIVSSMLLVAGLGSRPGKILAALLLSALALFMVKSYLIHTAILKAHNETQEDEIRALLIRVKSLYEGLPFGVPFTLIALEAEKRGAINLAAGVPDYATPEVLASCRDEGFDSFSVKQSKLGGRKKASQYVYLQGLIDWSGESVPQCYYMVCSGENSLGFRARVQPVIESGQFQISALVNKNYRRSIGHLYCSGGGDKRLEKIFQAN